MTSMIALYIQFEDVLLVVDTTVYHRICLMGEFQLLAAVACRGCAVIKLGR